MKSIFKLIKTFYSLIDLKLQKKLYVFFLITMILIFSETFFLFSSIPFFSFSLGLNSPISKNIFFKNFTFYDSALIFIISLIISQLFKYIHHKFKIFFLSEITSNISRKANETILNLSYSEFQLYSSKNYIDTLTNRSNTLMVHFLEPLLNQAYNAISVFLILTLMIYVNPLISIFTILIFSINNTFVFRYISIKSRKTINEYLHSNNLLVGKLQNSYGNFISTYLDNEQDKVVDDIYKIDSNSKKLNGKITYYTGLPKLILEPLIYLIFFIIVIYFYNRSTLIEIIPVLGFIVFSSQRLLPNISGMVSSHSLYLSSLALANEYLELFNKKKHKTKETQNNSIIVNEFIYLNNILFKYNEKFVFNKFSYKFSINKKYFVYGKTGSGKSTLINLIVGLLRPTSGKIIFDNNVLENEQLKHWVTLFSYVSQTSYFENSSIKNIIIRNRSENLDSELLENAINISLLNEFVNINGKHLDSIIGENAYSLSGGQRQRLAIARAIYDNKKILILDESTSAMDSLTEKKVVENLLRLNKTIIFISHNTSLKHVFDEVLNLEEKN